MCSGARDQDFQSGQRGECSSQPTASWLRCDSRSPRRTWGRRTWLPDGAILNYAYIDGNGKQIKLASLNVALLKKAKRQRLGWIGCIPEMLERLSGLEGLSAAITFLSGKRQRDIDRGLFGDAVKHATLATLNAILELYPEDTRQKVHETIAIACRHVEAEWKESLSNFENEGNL